LTSRSDRPHDPDGLRLRRPRARPSPRDEGRVGQVRRGVPARRDRAARPGRRRGRPTGRVDGARVRRAGAPHGRHRPLRHPEARRRRA